jgi:hypothetical protein
MSMSKYRIKVVQPPRAKWLHHGVVRYQREDGLWVSHCICGWTSAPASHREELGWVCANDTTKPER